MLHRKRAIGNGRPFLPKLFLILVSHTTVLWYTVGTLSERGERNPNMIDVNEINLDAIRSTITFLSENEEYGDDWSEEIATLDKVMDFCLEHGHRDE